MNELCELQVLMLGFQSHLGSVFEDTAVCKVAGKYFVELTNLNVIEGFEDEI